MTAVEFALDQRLAADTVPVASLSLCDVLLMNDARYPWLILVPRMAGMVEIADLDPAMQSLLWQELNVASAALRAVAPGDKLNVGALGNIVRQLHVHLVIRRQSDEAWPGPVWGHGRSIPYAMGELEVVMQSLQEALTISRKT